MTDTERRVALKTLIQKHTADKLVDRKTARESLIKEGIYTSTGKLRAEYGGKLKKPQTLA